MELKGSVALITGGAMGLGRSYMEHLLAEGANVFFVDMNVKEGEKTRAELEQKMGKGRVMFQKCDVTNSTELEDAFKGAIKHFKKLDLVINNAGVATEQNAWERMIRINVDAVVFGTKLGMKYMDKQVKGQNGGTIVNIASISSLTKDWSPVPIYCSTKAFVNQFTRTIAAPLHTELTGIRMLCVNPGRTDTAILKKPKEMSEGSSPVGKDMKRISDKYKVQKVSTVGEGMIQILKIGSNGSLWFIENDEPPKEISLEYKVLRQLTK